MIDYMAAMVDDITTKFKPDDTAPNHAAEYFFTEVTTDDLDMQKISEYYTFVAKGLFDCKQDCQYIGPTIPALCTRLKNPNRDDWHKLHQLI